VACETIVWVGLSVRFFTFFFQNKKKTWLCNLFLSCLTRFLEHVESNPDRWENIKWCQLDAGATWATACFLSSGVTDDESWDDRMSCSNCRLLLSRLAALRSLGGSSTCASQAPSTSTSSESSTSLYCHHHQGSMYTHQSATGYNIGHSYRNSVD